MVKNLTEILARCWYDVYDIVCSFFPSPAKSRGYAESHRGDPHEFYRGGRHHRKSVKSLRIPRCMHQGDHAARPSSTKPVSTPCQLRGADNPWSVHSSWHNRRNISLHAHAQLELFWSCGRVFARAMAIAWVPIATSEVGGLWAFRNWATVMRWNEAGRIRTENDHRPDAL